MHESVLGLYFFLPKMIINYNKKYQPNLGGCRLLIAKVETYHRKMIAFLWYRTLGRTFQVTTLLRFARVYLPKVKGQIWPMTPRSTIVWPACVSCWMGGGSPSKVSWYWTASYCVSNKVGVSMIRVKMHPIAYFQDRLKTPT